MKEILAGVLIGMGDIALLTVDNRYIGALLFSVALLSIIELGLPLYTGRIGQIIHHGNFLVCLYILFMNVVGVGLMTCLATTLDDEFIGKLENAAIHKFDRTCLQLFIAGILCNVLIHVAVTARNTAVTILCVMVFILSGYEHSIADFMYALASGDIYKWLFVVLGNTVGGVMTGIFLSV